MPETCVTRPWQRLRDGVTSLTGSVTARKDARPVSQSPLKFAACARVAVGVATAIMLAGCGAGQITQTSTQVSAVDGAAGTVGQIAVRDASIVFGPSDTAAVHAAGGDAALQLSIVNFGATSDKLVGASSPVARSVTFDGNPSISEGRALIVGGGGTGGSGGDSAAPAPAPTAVATAIPTPDAQGDTSARMVLTGLTQDIRSGLTYPVVFTFERAGAVTVQVPVANPTTPRTDSPAS